MGSNIIRKSTRIEGRVESKNWEDSMILAGEAMGILDVVWYITRRYKHIENREVVICSDNKINLKNQQKSIQRK